MIDLYELAEAMINKQLTIEEGGYLYKRRADIFFINEKKDQKAIELLEKGKIEAFTIECIGEPPIVE